MLSVASSSGIRKRRHEFDQGNTSGIKLPRAEFYFVLESESDITSSEDDKESVSSIQNKSTDFAKDTSDTSSKTSRYESDFESLAGVEYEVMSLSDHEPENPFSSYSTGTESIGWREPLGEGSETEAQSMWADDSSVTSDLTNKPPQPQLPFRSCVKCKAQSNVLQYCHSCYKVRKDFFPPRPKRCKKKGAKPSFKREPPKLTEVERKDDMWMESSSSQELIPTSSGEGLCNICFKNPKNGAFLHCRWVHIYSCYECSLKVWCTNKCCPLCKSKIRQVLKVAVA
uniref:RING-type domain-containing protein n=1 Tax=Homalodisca liturata TaxID=320908 RepID=A0A1B6II06_9HEMI